MHLRIEQELAHVIRRFAGTRDADDVDAGLAVTTRRCSHFAGSVVTSPKHVVLRETVSTLPRIGPQFTESSVVFFRISSTSARCASPTSVLIFPRFGASFLLTTA
jgi:hypothetical protein